jgi:uncharacterized protein (TIGR03118 family)
MKHTMKFVFCAAAMSAGILPAMAQTKNVYLQTVLVSNAKNGTAVVDPNLLDPWGISFSGTSPFWVSNHLSGTSTLYNGSGVITPTVVTVPAGSASTGKGRPTGQVWNGTATAFLLANAKSASFIFATEDGTISGWNGGTVSTILVDNSKTNAVYKGLAIGTSATGPTLYAANFRSGKIDVFSASWAPATLAGSFTDPMVPSGFAPFNIWNIGGVLYVAYAKQDANQYLDVAGAGNGYVATFDLNGNLKTHLVSGGALNSPWGVAIAPAGWGAFGGALLVGNFGDGKINAFDPVAGSLLGTLQDSTGNPIAISGLWALVFGNGGRGGDVNTLYFTAGVPNGTSVQRGILGSLAPPSAVTSVVNAASQVSGPVAPGEIVVINGQTVGPSPIVSATVLPATAPLTTTLGATSVTVNGVAAPIVYANGSQTSVQIPYEIAGATTASIVVSTPNQTTAAFSIPASAVAPGLFTINFSGTGQIVALNADGTVNSSKNPAARGSMILMFATGEGMTSPAGVDGAVQANTMRMPVAPVAVTFNGVSATVVFAGGTPKDVAGVLEIQVQVPTAVTPGESDVLLSIGGVAAQSGAQIYLK